jgi:hypothetical protein
VVCLRKLHTVHGREQKSKSGAGPDLYAVQLSRQQFPPWYCIFCFELQGFVAFNTYFLQITTSPSPDSPPSTRTSIDYANRLGSYLDRYRELFLIYLAAGRLVPHKALYLAFWLPAALQLALCISFYIPPHHLPFVPLVDVTSAVLGSPIRSEVPSGFTDIVWEPTRDK